MHDYDLVVIGAGPGGYVAAIRAAQFGMKVALVEKDKIGGTCLNRGCVPTKAMLHTAVLMREIKSCGEFGITVSDAALNIDKLYERKNEVSRTLREGINGLLSANGVDVYQCEAKILDPGHVKAGEDILCTVNILIATGSRPIRLPIPGLDLPDILDSDELLADTGKLYKRLVIIGGGVMGVEFAAIYNLLGCEVTVIEALDRILPTMDREISQNLRMILKRRGVEIHTGALLESVEKSGDGLVCSFSVKGKGEKIACDGILLTVGRALNTDELLAGGLDLEIEDGFIPVDENFETCIKGIYAIGDVVKGGPQLAHAASAHGLTAVCAMAGKDKAKYAPDMSVVPACVYTDPEIAFVGITADEASSLGIPVKTGKFIMSANAKSIIEMAERGFVKLVFHEESEVLLGAQLMCPRATDMIGELATAVANKLTLHQITRVIRAHPTFGEAVTEAAEEAEGLAVHIMPQRR